MILAVPAIGVIKVILSHSYYLRPFVILLEDKNDATPAEALDESESKPVDEG